LSTHLTIPSSLSKINFNIVHPPTPWSSQWSLCFWLSHQYPTCICLLPNRISVNRTETEDVWDVTLYTPQKISRSFEVTFRFHLHLSSAPPLWEPQLTQNIM
jgi:hypothetical protein